MSPWHPAAGQLEEAGIRPVFLGLERWDPRFLTRFLPLPDPHRPDVVHLHSFKSQLAGGMAAQLRRIPTVVHVHDHNRIPRPLRPLLRRLGADTGCLVGITQSVTRYAMREYQVPTSRCRTVPHGTDPESAAAPPEAGAPVGRCRRPAGTGRATNPRMRARRPGKSAGRPIPGD